MRIFDENQFVEIFDYQKQMNYIKNRSNIDWVNVLRNEYLSERFLEDNIEKLKTHIHTYKYLSETFMNKHKDEIIWDEIGVYQNLSEEFILSHRDVIDEKIIKNIVLFQKVSSKILEIYIEETPNLLIDWDYICKNQDLTEEFIEKHIDKLDFFLLSKYQVLTEKFIEKHMDKLDIFELSKNNKFSHEFIVKYRNEFPMFSLLKEQNFKNQYIIKGFGMNLQSILFIFKHQSLTEEEINNYLKKYENIINENEGIWMVISKNQRLSEEFMRNNINKIDLWMVARHQVLSEEFIKEFMFKSSKKQNNEVFKFQELSDEFIIENIRYLNFDDGLVKLNRIPKELIKKFKSVLDLNYLLKNSIIEESVLEKYSDDFDWNNILRFQPLSEEFIEKHKEKVNWYELSKNIKMDIKILKKYKYKIQLKVFCKIKFSMYDKNNKRLTKNNKEDENYYKLYKIYNNDDILRDFNIPQKSKVQEVIKHGKLNGIEYLSNKYINLNFKEFENYIENDKREKEEERRRKEKRKREISKNKMLKKIRESNSTNEMVF